MQVIENLRMMDYKFSLVQAKVEHIFKGTRQINNQSKKLVQSIKRSVE